MKALGTVGAVFLGILLFIVICVGGWFGYWALTKEATSKRAEINRSTFEFQQARRDDLVRLVSEVASIDTQITVATNIDTQTALRAQRTAIVAQACRSAAEIDGDYPNGTATFVAIECGE